MCFHFAQLKRAFSVLEQLKLFFFLLLVWDDYWQNIRFDGRYITAGTFLDSFQLWTGTAKVQKCLLHFFFKSSKEMLDLFIYLFLLL